MRCPDPDRRWPRWAAAVVVVAAALVPVLTAGGPAGAAPVPVRLTWMAGDAAPGTPLRYDRVGVLAIGPAGARNVVVLEPGTEAGSAYFASLARWIVATSPGWQVWSVERRENLLEDQSELNAFKRHRADAAQLYDYYLGYLKDPAVTRHLQTIPNEEVAFAKQWGMAVAVGDLRRVVRAAEARGGKVVLGGHSLGGSVVTAYATWDFGGHPGADGLAEAMDPAARQLVAPIRAANAGEPRLTLTGRMILRARAIALEIEGEAKLATLAAAIEPGPEEAMPIRAVLRRAADRLTVFSAKQA